jgi:signal transduction histidine kinase
MRLLLSLYFFILAIIQGGLLCGVFFYYRAKLTIRPGQYWISSLFFSVIALTTFGIGVLSVADTVNPKINFSISNTLFYIAAALQALFFSSLNRSVGRKQFIVVAISTLIFFGVFEVMRSAGTYESRTIFLASVMSLLFLWQITELKIKRRRNPSIALRLLQYSSTLELLFNIYRIFFLLSSSTIIRDVSEVPQILILITIGQLVVNTLSYIFIVAYWAERISIDNYQKRAENAKIKSLLQERELLIGSLLKANKTAATGALSASIAHELNQPLAATSINIQYLQKRLADGDLSPEVQKEILDTLLIDNQRAANIIHSLRGIFSDQKVVVGAVVFATLLDSIVEILKPELMAQKIQLIIDLDPKLSINGNRDELQQVLLNLLGNSIEALSSSDKAARFISIRGHYISEGVELCVVDNGPGVPQPRQDQLFELLTGNKSQGMGLGLWLCKHIITRHGGRIFYRDAEAGGAEFVTILPLKSPLQ